MKSAYTSLTKRLIFSNIVNMTTAVRSMVTISQAALNQAGGLVIIQVI